MMSRICQKFLLICLALLAMSCGGPDLMHAEPDFDENGIPTNGGVGDFSLSTATATYTFEELTANLHYDPAENVMRLTVFGADTTGVKYAIVYLNIFNASTLQPGDTLSTADETLFASVAYRDDSAGASTQTEFIAATSATYTVTLACATDSACNNAATFTVAATVGGESLTISGDYVSGEMVIDQ